MLFKARVLDGIADGSVTLAFRRWERPHARGGGSQRTRVGVVAFDAVEVIPESSITDEDARRAGFAGRDELLAELSPRNAGSVYRVELRLAGPDPRVELRERSRLSAADVAALRTRLARLDAHSHHGAWAETVLRLIADNPGVRAPDLAASLGRETQPFKRDVRKLKELGLTESLPVGYRLSPRGRALLKRLL
ncbi:MAG TPA: hypothetical protein VGF25_15975 [Thermoleophilaceae bacterium]